MMIPLTAIQIRYMRVLYQLGSDRTVKLSEVAEVLKVSKPSVHSMFCKLRQYGLITQNEHGFSQMTELGKKTVGEYEKQYEVLYNFMRDVLHLDEEAAQDNALTLLGSENHSAPQLCQGIEHYWQVQREA